MNKIVTLRQALSDNQYFGEQLAGESWAAWRPLMYAIMGEPLEPDELAIFERLTQRPSAPAEPVREFVGVIGRRGGKTRALAVLAAYIATCIDHRRILAPGEIGQLPFLAQTKDQAASGFNFLCGAIGSSPALRGLIIGRTADTLSLSTGIDVTVRPASFRSVRGGTSIAVIADECAFWRSDDVSANPDTEILRALKPTLLSTQGPLIVISSPYARRGYLWNTYAKHYGAYGNPGVLVAQAASQTMNPLVDMDWIGTQFDEDPVGSEAEFNSQFRTDVETFIDRDIVESCVERDCFEIPPCGKAYYGFVDASGGTGGDSMTMAIAHLEGEVAVLDCVRERRPPFSPASVCGEFSSLFKSYGLRRVTSDRWGTGFVQEAFSDCGIECRQSAKPKSELYLEMLPMLMSGRVRLLDNARLLSQLVNLERKTARGGRDTIDHPPRMHDDVANACSGALVTAKSRPLRSVASTGTFILGPRPRGVELRANMAPPQWWIDSGKKKELTN